MISGAEERAKAAAEARRGVKKGPWTASEDAILTEYVNKNGEGNWNMVQKNTGLARCGKSCRLRWANHLRPDLKKGSFSQAEEKIILDLHAKLGNKWARMASQLPGRTDNEIKNFWNTRMKRRQRAGLPIYPHDQPNQLINNPQNMSSHLHHHNLNQNSLIKPNIRDPTNPYTFSHPTANNSHVSQFVPNFSNTNIAMSTIPYTFQYGSGLVRPSAVRELPSSQTPASSDHDHHTSDGHDHDNDHDYDHHVVSGQSDNWFAKSGLLGDLVVEGRAIARNKRAKKTSTASPEPEGGLNCGGVTENFGSADKSSIGIENDEDPIDMSSMEDDLMSLLSNFPSSTMPVPDWYSGGDTADSGAQNAKPDLADGKCEHLGSCHWNNMPRIC